MEPFAQSSENRDYSTISPSAKSLLFLKGHTNIPYAKEAAEQMILPEKYEPDFSRRDFAFWARVVHFENRYWSLDQLLAGININNVLELSSGFSMRGLASVAAKEGLHYIDTDLPEVIGTKQSLVEAMQLSEKQAGSKLEMLPLNALDEYAFKSVVSRFPSGPLVILNEGLLMYLNTAEKEKLCRIIHGILKERGGYWITADVYLKRQLGQRLEISDQLNEFFKQHHIDDQMFESFDQAEAFFNKEGFMIDKEAVRDRSKLQSIGYLMQSASDEQLIKLQSMGRVHATWRLKIAD